jgi:hypothetical protein
MAKITSLPDDSASRPQESSRATKQRSIAEVAGDVVSSPAGKTVIREVFRGLFGLLGAKPARRTTRRSRW